MVIIMSVSVHRYCLWLIGPETTWERDGVLCVGFGGTFLPSKTCSSQIANMHGQRSQWLKILSWSSSEWSSKTAV